MRSFMTYRGMAYAFIVMLTLTITSSPAAHDQDDTPQKWQRLLQSNRKQYGIAGQAIVVMHNGKVVFRGVDGEADISRHQPVLADSVFSAFSISKLFVSTLIMQLVEQGKLDLNRPASEYIHGLPARWKTIPLRDFLDHTSGVPEYFGDGKTEAVTSKTRFPSNLSAVFASLADRPLTFTPGTEVRYTQTNYLVLSELLASHYGKPYPQVVSERIIQPLHLEHTWLGKSNTPESHRVKAYTGINGTLREDDPIAWPAYAYGHAELYTTADDLARFMEAVASGKLVGRTTLERLWQPHELANGQRGWFATGWEYGENHGYREVGHDGGARSRVRILFRDSLAGDSWIIVYLTNGSATNVWSRTLVESIKK